MPSVSIRSLKCICLALVLCGAAQGQETRHIYVSVEGSKSGPIPGVSPSNFSLKENGIARAIESVTFGPEPASIGVVLDTTGTIGLSFFEKDRDEFAASVSDLTGRPAVTDEYCLIGFNRQAAVFVDWTARPKDIEDGIRRFVALEDKEKKPGAPIYDVLGEALRSFERAKYSKRVLLLFSDGMDKGSKLGRKDVVKLVESSDVQIYAFVLTDGAVNITTTPNLNFLDAIAHASGGVFNVLYTSLLFAEGGRYVPNSPLKGSEVRKTLGRLMAQIGGQYKLQFKSDLKGEVSYTVKLALETDMKKGRGDVIVRHQVKRIFAH